MNDVNYIHIKSIFLLKIIITGILSIIKHFLSYRSHLITVKNFLKLNINLKNFKSFIAECKYVHYILC